MIKMVNMQNDFLRNVAQLIFWLQTQGYQVTGGELHRPEWVAKIYAEQGKGSKTSMHISRLAIDLMLFRDGEYLTDSADYKPAGEYWKSLDKANCWGGDFHQPDGNHFSRSIGDGRA